MIRAVLRRTLFVSCAATALAIGAAAQAQETDGRVEEVIVTAQRRSENLQTVPVSVDAIAGERLSSIFTSGQDVLALSARSPGLFVESSNGRAAPRFYIRGLGNADFDLAASQPVSVILDDVVLENVVLKSTPLFDLDRVEVLRGPQGTLFGRNTTAGIVKFDSIRPSDTFSARGSASLGTYKSSTFDAGVGGPVVAGKLDMRFSVLAQHRDDWINNAYTGLSNALGGYDERAARVQLLFTPTDNLKVLFNVHGRDLDGTAAVFRANILTKGSNKLNANYIPNTVFFDSGARNPQHYQGLGESLNVAYDFGAATLTSITATESTHGYSRGDIDGGNPGGPGFIPFQSESQDGLTQLRQTTEEIRLASNGAGPLTWQVGLYYFDTTYRDRTDPFFAPATTIEQSNTSWAGFGQGSYRVTDALTLTAGLRYTYDKKNMSVVSGPNIVSPISIKDDKPSWDLSAFYAFNPDVSVYAKVAEGFRGPSIQGRDIAFFSPASVARSETVLSYEAGLKSELLDHRLRLNGAVYTYTLHHPQFSAVGGASNANHLLNAAKGQAWGFELDSEFRPVANLILTAGYSYTDTKIKDPTLTVAGCAACTVTDPVNAAGLANINGNPFPNAPKYILDFTARYSIPLSDGGELFAFTDWAVEGKTNLFLYQSKEFYTNGDFEGGLKLGYARRDGSWEAAIFARNITNEKNLAGAIDFDNLTGFVNDPRIVGVSLSAQFR